MVDSDRRRRSDELIDQQNGNGSDQHSRTLKRRDARSASKRAPHSSLATRDRSLATADAGADQASLANGSKGRSPRATRQTFMYFASPPAVDNHRESACGRGYCRAESSTQAKQGNRRNHHQAAPENRQQLEAAYLEERS